MQLLMRLIVLFCMFWLFDKWSCKNEYATMSYLFWILELQEILAIAIELPFVNISLMHNLHLRSFVCQHLVYELKAKFCHFAVSFRTGYCHLSAFLGKLKINWSKVNKITPVWDHKCFLRLEHRGLVQKKKKSFPSELKKLSKSPYQS